MDADHIIPKYIHDNSWLATTWSQPQRENILVGDVEAVMSQECCNALLIYNDTAPTGFTPGKMWKAWSQLEKLWYLCWFDIPKDNVPWTWETHRRRIVIMEWKKLMGVENSPPNLVFTTDGAERLRLGTLS